MDSLQLITAAALGLGLAAAALFSLPMVLNPVVPLVGAIVVGWPAAVLTLAAAAAPI